MSTLQLYGDCVASLRSSLSFLESSVATLDAGVDDLPRLATVLSSVRHYELLPQPTLAAAEASLQNDIGPAVASLLDRAAHQLARQARRIDTLQAKAALQAGRLEGDRPKPDRKSNKSNKSSKSSKSNTTSTTSTSKNTKMANIAKSKVDPLKARMVRQRREQLKYSVARLEREVAQKEREMRQRMRQSTAGL